MVIFHGYVSHNQRVNQMKSTCSSAPQALDWFFKENLNSRNPGLFPLQLFLGVLHGCSLELIQ